MEERSKTKSLKDFINRIDGFGLSPNKIETMLKEFPIESRSIYIKEDTSQVFEIFKFIKPVEIEAFNSFLEQKSTNPDSNEINNNKKDLKPDKTDMEELPLVPLPLKRIRREFSLSDLEFTSHLENNASLQGYPESNIDENFINYKENKAITSQGINTLSSMSTGSSSLPSKPISDTSEDRIHNNVLSDCINRITNSNPAGSESSYKKLCIRPAKNCQNLG